MPVQTILEGDELKRARKALRRSAGLGDGASLLIKKKLIHLDFSKKLSFKSPGDSRTPVEESPVDGTLDETGFHSYPCF